MWPGVGGRRRLALATALGPAVLSIVAGLVAPGRAEAGETPWREGFDGGALNPARWVTTRDGDLREGVADVVDVSPAGAHDFRLRLRADTRGTRDDTVKFLGARTVRAFPVTAGTRIAVTLDWNGQANGSYLSAALILSPEATRVNPLRGRRWLKVEYVGVPPGRTARLAVALSAGGRERTLYDEGWPEVNRAGRAIGIQELILVFQRASFEVWENGERLLAARDTPLGFDVAHVYLQLSSHSNYPPREIFFDELRVSGPDTAEP
jgi:hypothetical protein